MGESFWQLDPDPRTVECEVCVIGAGIAGISAALRLEERGVRDIVVLEAHRPAFGASGRNAGYLMRGAADNYAAAVRQYGRDGARDLWRLTEDNLASLRGLGIDGLSGTTRRPSCLVALDEEEERELRDSVRLLREDGFEVEGLEPGSHRDGLWDRAPVRFGLLNPNDAVCHPHELVSHLADTLDARIRSGETAHRIHTAPGGLVVRTTGLEVEAERVLVCVNAGARALLPELRGLIEPNRGQMLLARPDEPVVIEHAAYLNHGADYIRQGPGGRIVFGGQRTFMEAEERTDSNETTPQLQSALEARLRDLIGLGFEVEARWAGSMAFTPDGLPIAGESGTPGVWICAGFNGHGMSMAHLTAGRAVDAMLEAGPGPFPIGRLRR